MEGYVVELNHKHLIYNSYSDTCRNWSVAEITLLLLDVVKVADMTVMMGPYVQRCDTEGNEGITGAVVIETSHCSIHIWDKGEIRFDLYSCKDFNEKDVVKLLNTYFFVADQEILYNYDYVILDRNEDNMISVYQPTP